MAPSSTITTEITHARTGRSMKKRASICGLFVYQWLLTVDLGFWLSVWHLYRLRLHGDAWPHLLQAVHDHPLARLEACGNLAQAVVERSEANGAGDDLVVMIDNVEGFLALVG